MGELSAADAYATSETLLRTGSFTTDDPCAHAQATVPWDVVITALSRSPYRHDVVFLGSPGLILYRETVWARTRIQGMLPPGMFCFTVPLRCGSDTSYWSARPHESGLPVMMPGAVHAEFSAGQQHLVALVDLELLREGVPDDLMASIGRAACQHVVPASGVAVARLGAMLNALLDEAQAEPHAPHHPHAVRAMQQDVLTAFWRSLTPPLSPARRVGRAIRQHRLQRAVEYLRSADTALVTVGDLCAAANLAERTLEYAFREAFGISPQRFLHLRRYHAARRDLLAADGGTATVQAIAQHNGFYQMGRFAVGYKQLFGESPSDALKRPPLELPGRLPRFRDSLRP